MVTDAVTAETELAEFGILGPLEVSRGGRMVPLGGPRQRAVLALLLLEANRVVSLDRLAEDVWGGYPPEGWVTTVQIYVSHLRQALEPGRARGAAGEVLVTRNPGYLLRVDRERLDAVRFQDGFTAGRAALEAGRYAEAAGMLRAALGLWRSGVLADLADYAFTRPEAARLEELRLAAVEARIDADLALGRHDALTAELEQLAAEHPVRERSHGQLMLALYRCGRQADALAAYRRVRDLLAGELGIDPGEPLRRLQASVLAQDPALDWHGDRQDPADGHRPGADVPVTSPAVGPSPRPAGPGRALAWARRPRRLLAIGSALAVAAAACIVAVARPWAGEPAGLPADSVGLISPSGERVGGPVSVASPAGLAYGDGSVWAVDSADGTLWRIDPATHAVVQQIPVGSAPTAVAITGQDVWVANSGDGTVSRVSAAAGRAVDTIQVGNLPVAIAAGRGGVWVANEGDDTVDRIDPATGSVTVYDSLVALRRSGGAAGLTLVPDLATRLPRAADGGTTYTFTLRRGIRYSSGALLRASDIRRGIQRQLIIGPAVAIPGYYDGILGARACQQYPKRCDLSAGIVTDDATGTVTFHLTQADPDFLYKLALSVVAPAPPGSPDRAISRAPFLPGTGPYMISQVRPNKSMILIRNPHFRQWSYAAQPAGYPSVIRYVRMAGQSRQESAVIAGQADLAVLLSGGDRSLAVRYPARFHYDLKMNTQFATLNTRQPPFTNIKARQAVSYAIDRARIIELFNYAPGQVAATCQMLPPDFPGHQPYCPYTTGTRDGGWRGPDMAKARQLVRESGTTNVPVTVWSFDIDPGKSVGYYLVGLLRDLGYRASLHAVTNDRFWTDLSNPRTKIQISVGEGWGADFPAPSTFFGPLLSCQSVEEPATNNWPGFCDHHVDALASQAQATQLTDPAAARRLWAQADRIVTDQAPYVPIFNVGMAVFVSSRSGNYQPSPVYGPLLDQMWSDDGKFHGQTSLRATGFPPASRRFPPSSTPARTDTMRLANNNQTAM